MLLEYLLEPKLAVPFLYFCLVAQNIHFAISYQLYKCSLISVVVGVAVALLGEGYIESSQEKTLAISPFIFMAIFKIIYAIPFLNPQAEEAETSEEEGREIK